MVIQIKNPSVFLHWGFLFFNFSLLLSAYKLPSIRKKAVCKGKAKRRKRKHRDPIGMGNNRRDGVIMYFHQKSLKNVLFTIEHNY